MRVSIIITNHNYRDYVKDAVESARRQTHPDVELIVVDDGSTDGSQLAIERLAAADRRIQVVSKENGGQASAMNIGFARSSGEAVLFLDADDMLMPDAVERVVAALRAEPSAAKVHFGLHAVDRDGRELGWRLPAGDLPRGDLRRDVIRDFGRRTFFWPPTSGGAYRRETLAKLLPMPEETYRMCADEYLNYMSPLLGPIVALDEPAARYRVHGSNNYAMNQIDERFAQRIRASIDRAVVTRSCQLGLLGKITGLPVLDEIQAVERLRSFAIMRLVSLKLGAGGYPVAGDSLWRAARDAAFGCLRTSGNPGAGAVHRVIAAAWVAAVTASPPVAARKLIATKYQPRARRFTRVERSAENRANHKS